MVEDLKTLISVVELTEDKVGLNTLKDILTMAKSQKIKADKYSDLYRKIVEHQQEDEDADLCSIGEIVLNELNLWM